MVESAVRMDKTGLTVLNVSALVMARMYWKRLAAICIDLPLAGHL